MCTRYRAVRDYNQLSILLPELARINFEYNPNVAPTEAAPFILANGSKVEIKIGHFGINQDPALKRGPLLNARTDSIKRGIHKKLVSSQRCIIPAEGFYEFREEGDTKQPYYFARQDGLPLAIAGIWDWSELKGDNVLSFAMLTDEPNALVKPFHDRMPLVVADPVQWLTAGNLEAINAVAETLFTVRPVNPLLNKWQTKDVDIIDSFPTDKNKAGLFD